LSTEIRFGPGLFGKLGETLKDMGGVRPLVITDPGLAKTGLLDKALGLLPRGTVVFDRVEPNPKDTTVQAAAKAYREGGADSLIALGGGSAIDCAKAAGVLIAHGDENIKEFEDRTRIVRYFQRFIAVPTTAGTGSEITFSGVITDTASHYKMTIKHPRMAADIALCDPELTLSMPPALTAATGMDALTHAIEAFTATCAEPISDALALQAVELIAGNLLRAFNDGETREARTKMLMASLLAGLAFSHSDVASVHCIAEALGGTYDLPHGICNAVMLPSIMAYNRDYAKARYARIALALGLSPASEEEGATLAVEAVQRLARDLRLPSFASLGVKVEDFPAIAAASVRNGSNSSNPRPMKEENYLEVLQRMAAQETEPR